MNNPEQLFFSIISPQLADALTPFWEASARIFDIFEFLESRTTFFLFISPQLADALTPTMNFLNPLCTGAHALPVMLDAPPPNYILMCSCTCLQWLQLYHDGSLRTGVHALPVMLDAPPPNYSFIPPHVPLPGTKWVDSHKPVFTLHLEASTSVHPQVGALFIFLVWYFYNLC